MSGGRLANSRLASTTSTAHSSVASRISVSPPPGRSPSMPPPSTHGDGGSGTHTSGRTSAASCAGTRIGRAGHGSPSKSSTNGTLPKMTATAASPSIERATASGPGWGERRDLSVCYPVRQAPRNALVIRLAAVDSATSSTVQLIRTATVIARPS